MSVQTSVEIRNSRADTSGCSACAPSSPPAEVLDLARVVRLLDELDDLLAWVKLAWRPMARRRVGVAGVLVVVVILALPA